MQQAAAAGETQIQRLPEFLREVFYPTSLESFRETFPTGEAKFVLHRGRDGSSIQEILIDNLFPFMTILDLKLALYIALNKEDYAIPEFVHLALEGSEPGKTSPLEYSWTLPGASGSGEGLTPFFLPPPFQLAGGAAPLDSRFVDSNGDRRIVEAVYRERLTIEDMFLKKGGAAAGAGALPEIHAYFYKDLEAAVPGAKPVSELNWNGRLYPYFPYLSVNENTPTEKQRTRARRLATIFSRRQQFISRVEGLLELGLPLIPLSLASVRLLRLTWGKRKEIPGVESIFYQAAVSHTRPFMRLIPSEGAGISKVFMREDEIPDLQEPSVLLTWSQEMNPTPEKDYAFAKVLVREGYMNVPPLYSTLRLFDDGSADVIVEPPRGVKKLDPRQDLGSYGQALLTGLEGIPHLGEMPDIGNAAIVLGVRLKPESSPILGPRTLRERLPIFSAFFQEIKPLPGERPLAMLRYKLISNFSSEDRVNQFISQLISRRLVKGDAAISDLKDLVADEFQLDVEDAKNRVAEKMQTMGEVTLVDVDTKDYMLESNPGIDIAIYAKHPFYTFHLYRVNSVENFRRVITALSLLISVPSEDLKIRDEDARELARAEEAEAAAEDEFKNIDEQGAAAAPAAEQAPVAVPGDFEDIGGAEDMPEFMDLFTGDENEMTLEEEATGVAAPAPRTSLRKELAAEAEIPEQELADAQEVRVTEAGVTTIAEDVGIANFFLRKLQKADSRLFDYAKANPTLNPYVSGCQPTHGRQPAVLNQDAFDEMREEYAKDGVVFQIFPLEPGEPETIEGVMEKEYFTVLRYGTTPENQNYYICSRYFCTRDEIVIREVDLESNRMRRPIQRPDGTFDYSKKPGECPFCRGKIIKNKKYPQPDETILERPVIPKTRDQRMLYIRFLKKSPHPEGFYLPCCFQNRLPIKYDDKAFDVFKEKKWGLPQRGVPVEGAVAAPLVEEEPIGPAAAAAELGYHVVDYWEMMASASKRYIVGAEKLPLDIGMTGSQYQGEPQIGLLPLVLNPYFDQDPTGLVSRSLNPQKLKEGVTAFLRIAVENRLRYMNDSFLAAIAPYYYLNTAAQMKEHILKTVTPRVFLALNYGNMALEFYDPATPVEKRPTDGELREWASNELQVDLQQENKEALVRAYLSYSAFEAWLRSPDTKKEFRHFALLLAQSKLLRREELRNAPGITFIVLDINKAGKMSVRCPPYGFNAEIHSRNDVAFLLHDWTGVWEPIFFVDNRGTEEDRRRVQISTLVFKRSESAGWPEIVSRRFQEYITQCSSTGRAVYTSQSSINPLSLIPATLARRVFQKEPRIIVHGVIRDSYNHLVALLLRERDRDGKQDEAPKYIIPFPVVDDGDLIFHLNLALDWDDPSFEDNLAPADVIARFYRKYIEPHFQIYNGYKVSRVAVNRVSGQIQAIQLRNGLFVPAKSASSEVDAAILMKHKVEVDEMEWTLNHEIVLQEREIEIPGEKRRLEIRELNEIFEHLRLTFSNWLAAKGSKGEFRKTLEEVIFSRRLPLFEKRKRLEILLSRQIEKWITTDFADEDEGAQAGKETSLLRVDCRLRNEASCSASSRCVWKKGQGEGNADAGRCLLHVPEEAPLGEDRAVSAPRLLLLRLIEELLRYSNRRRQLLNRDVAQIATLDKPVTIQKPGQVGKQIIYPEKSMAWFELLRLDWAKKREEEPRYLEEMSRDPSPVAEPLPAETDASRLPASLATFLGAPQDPKVGALRLLRAPFPALFTPLSILPSQIGVTDQTSELSMEMIDKIVEATGRSVIQIDIRSDAAMQKPLRRKPWGTKSFYPTVPVFIVTGEGPALLLEDPVNPSFLKIEAMPTTLKNLVLTAKGKIIMKKVVAPAVPLAAPAAAAPAEPAAPPKPPGPVAAPAPAEPAAPPKPRARSKSRAPSNPPAAAEPAAPPKPRARSKSRAPSNPPAPVAPAPAQPAAPPHNIRSYLGLHSSKYLAPSKFNDDGFSKK